MKTLLPVSCVLGILLLSSATTLPSAFAQRERHDNGGQRQNQNQHQIRNRNQGSITWEGHVDQVMEVSFQQGRTWTKRVSGRKGSGDAVFASSIPRKSVQMSVRQLLGRGRVWVQQQPDRSNGFTCVVRISDRPSGGDQYKFTLTWDN